MNLFSFRLAFIIVAISCFCPVSAQSSTLEIAPLDQGWYIDHGQHEAGHSNYVVEVVGATEWRNYFVFDVSPVDEDEVIVSATLQLYTWQNTTSATYELREFGETGISSDALMSGHSRNNWEGITIFQDLGDGLIYGSAEMNPDNSYSTIQIELTSDAINNLNESDGIFAIGGKGYYHDFVAHSNGPQGSILGISDLHPDNLLILKTQIIPEPTTLSLLLGVLGLFACRFMSRQKLP